MKRLILYIFLLIHQFDFINASPQNLYFGVSVINIFGGNIDEEKHRQIKFAYHNELINPIENLENQSGFQFYGFEAESRKDVGNVLGDKANNVVKCDFSSILSSKPNFLAALELCTCLSDVMIIQNTSFFNENFDSCLDSICSGLNRRKKFKNDFRLKLILQNFDQKMRSLFENQTSEHKKRLSINFHDNQTVNFNNLMENVKDDSHNNMKFDDLSELIKEMFNSLSQIYNESKHNAFTDSKQQQQHEQSYDKLGQNFQKGDEDVNDNTESYKLGPKDIEFNEKVQSEALIETENKLAEENFKGRMLHVDHNSDTTSSISPLPTPNRDVSVPDQIETQEKASHGISYENNSSLNTTLVLQQVIDDVILESSEHLSRLERKQENAIIENLPPLLEFGREANTLIKVVDRGLEKLLKLKSLSGKNEEQVRNYITKNKRFIYDTIFGKSGLARLFRNQMDALREHYGSCFDETIDELEEGAGNKPISQENIAKAAAHAVEGFKVAARHAIPQLNKPIVQKYLGHYDVSTSFQGLLNDLKEKTLAVTELDESWNTAATGEDDDDNDESVGFEQSKPAKWYKKLAARMVGFAINYLQGWLALQGLRKAAAERDRLMPKFPLF